LPSKTLADYWLWFGTYIGRLFKALPKVLRRTLSQ